MNDKHSPEWEQISKALFAKSPEQTSDAFTQSVMKRIEAAESGPRLVRVPAQWLAPLMGLAAMLVLAILPSRPYLSAEGIMAGEEPDEMMSFFMEEA